MALLAFWASHRAELAGLFGQHVLLVAISTLAAIAIGVPIGVFAARRPRLSAPLVGIANIVQTIPSLAMFGFLLPVPLVGGVGARAAVFVLILYGLLPIIRTTIAGLNGIDPPIREAGTAMGMTPRELLFQVELPLAMPSIVAGVRVAAVVGVGSATIAAAIGAGGLGEYIYRGLSMVDTTVILAGAVPAALLALAVDGGAALGGAPAVDAPAPGHDPRRGGRRRGRDRRVRSGRAVCSREARPASSSSARRTSPSRTCSARSWRRRSSGRPGCAVERKLNLGGTLICDRALAAGDIDVYVEYTGTALTAVFHQPIARDAGVGVRAGARDVRGHGADAAAAARLRQHVRDPGARVGRARARPQDDRRCGEGGAAGGGPGSATNFSSGPTAIPGWRGRTACDSRGRRT